MRHATVGRDARVHTAVLAVARIGSIQLPQGHLAMRLASSSFAGQPATPTTPYSTRSRQKLLTCWLVRVVPIGRAYIGHPITSAARANASKLCDPRAVTRRRSQPAPTASQAFRTSGTRPTMIRCGRQTRLPLQCKSTQPKVRFPISRHHPNRNAGRSCYACFSKNGRNVT